MRILLIGLGILLTGGLLSGCGQTDLSKNQTQNEGQRQNASQVTASRNSDNSHRDNQDINSTQSEYIVDGSDNMQPRTLLETAQKGELSTEEKAGLVQMREEEKLAHDVYVTMYEKWGQNIFNNISKSEQTHTDTVKYILDKYGIADPVISTKIGEFTAPEMTKLYNSLVEQGNKSLVDALIVGATVEDLDIKDLEDLLLKTDNEDIKIAYQNLNKGSRNHLRAFMRNLERNGGAYQSQFISQNRFDEILTGEQEKGSVDAQGKSSGNGGHGDGRGQGNGSGQGNGRGNGQGRRGI